MSVLRTVKRRLYYLCNGRHQSFPQYLSYHIEGKLKNELYHDAMSQNDQWGCLNGYDDYYSLVRNEFIGMWGNQNRYMAMNRHIAGELYRDYRYGVPHKDRNRRLG